MGSNRYLSFLLITLVLVSMFLLSAILLILVNHSWFSLLLVSLLLHFPCSFNILGFFTRFFGHFWGHLNPWICLLLVWDYYFLILVVYLWFPSCLFLDVGSIMSKYLHLNKYVTWFPSLWLCCWLDVYKRQVFAQTH